MIDNILPAGQASERIRREPVTIVAWVRQGRTPAHRVTWKSIRSLLPEVIAAFNVATASGTAAVLRVLGREAGHVACR